MNITTGIADAVRALESEQTRLSADLENLKRQSQVVALELRRVRQGLAALQGQSASGKMAMGGLSDQVAKDVALAALPGTIPELQAKLLQHARAQGVSGSGVHLVLGRVLKDQRIVKVDDRYTLVAETRGRFSEALTTVLDDMSPPPNITVAAEKVPMRR